MADTLTQIANMALVAIKKETIKSLDEVPSTNNASSPNNKSAAVINVVIDQTIRWIQANARWSDLLTKAELTLVDGPTDAGNYIYAQPTDILGIPRLVSTAAYEVQGKRLVTSDPEAELWYVRWSLEPSEWNTFLTQAIIDELAARIAPRLNVSAAESKELRGYADRSLIDNNASDYTFRSSPIQNDGWYALNQAREGIGGRYAGQGRIAALRADRTYNRSTYLS